MDDSHQSTPAASDSPPQSASDAPAKSAVALAHRRIPRPTRKQVITIIITAILAIAMYFLLPDSVNAPQRRMLCIFVVASIFWAAEVLPLFATSLLVVGLMILLLATDGGLAAKIPAFYDMPDDYSVSYKVFMAPFGSNIIMLFMGGFLLSRALSKHSIDKAIAAKILQPFTKSPLLLIYGVLGISAFFSMWMSNTATAAMMLAIIAPIIKSFPSDDKFHRGVILAVPFGANIGGIGTPIGTPPNAVAFELINNSENMSISFLQWMMIGLPLALFLLAGIGPLLLWTHKPKGELKIKKLEGPKAISWYGYLTIGILLGAVVLWLTGSWHGIGAGTVALLAAAALTALHVLDKYDVDSIDWNILILMWGGLAMGVGMKVSGLTSLLSDIDLASLPGGGGLTVLAIAVVVLSIGLSTFMSNTATANLLVPLVMALAVGAAINNVYLAVICALGCSFAMAMPVSTPPNAIAFATGKITPSRLLVLGGGISIFSGIVLVLGARFVLPLVLGR